MGWARFSQVCEQWQRHVAPQLGINVEQLMLGDVLSSIIGDDAGCFSWANRGEFYDVELAERSKESLLFRLNWEIAVPELPDDIRLNLEVARDEFALGNHTDWSSKRRFLQASDRWHAVRREVEALIDENDDYEAAIIYHDHAWRTKLHELYNVFLQVERE
jgi:hypothetical protein